MAHGNMQIKAEFFFYLGLKATSSDTFGALRVSVTGPYRRGSLVNRGADKGQETDKRTADRLKAAVIRPVRSR